MKYKLMPGRSHAFSILLAGIITFMSVSTFNAEDSNPLPDITEREAQNAQFSLETAQEGMVLLDNRELGSGFKSLPIHESRVALFGAGAVATIKGGRGSGSVNNRKTTGIYEALIEHGYTVTSAGADADDPGDYILKYYDEYLYLEDRSAGDYIVKLDDLGTAWAVEHPLTDEQLAAASDDCDTAIYVIARNSGENCERSPVPGDYYLSEIEYRNLSLVSERFENVIVLLNTGSVLDTNFYHGLSEYSACPDEFVNVQFPSSYAFDADQFDREKDLYYVCADESADRSTGILDGKLMSKLPEGAEFDLLLADPESDKVSLVSTAGYYYWDPQFGTEQTNPERARYRSVIFNHAQDALYTYDPEEGEYKHIPGDSRFDPDKDYYMFNVFRRIEGLDSLVYISQGGQECGRAVVNLLEGKVSPSGKLTDTWAVNYFDYPSSETFAHNDGMAAEEYYAEGIFTGYRYFDTFEITPAYPFGYGKSFTQFRIDYNGLSLENTYSDFMAGGSVSVSANVRNVGAVPGKEVVQIYYSAPGSELDQPLRQLIGFGKTRRLSPGEAETITINFTLRSMASYDPERSAYILEKGDYTLWAGNCSRNAENDSSMELYPQAVLRVPETIIVQQLQPLGCWAAEPDYSMLASATSRSTVDCPGEPADDSDVLDEYFDEPCDNSALPTYEIVIPEGYSVPKVDYSPEDVTVYVSDSTKEEYSSYLKQDGIDEVFDGAEGAVSYTDYAGNEKNYSVHVVLYDENFADATLADVSRGDITIEEFVSGLTLEELANLAEGQKNQSPEALARSVKGSAGETYGDLAESKGIPNITMADGPAGLRLTPSYTDEVTGEAHYQYCTAWPIGTMTAQTWNKDLVRRMGACIGDEMLEMGVSLWLAPGMNIHRDPLCGRNFEYFSEDPLITGIMAAELTAGVQYGGNAEITEENFRGIGVTLKHFFGNQQEAFRQFTNSRMSERTAREIYLKGFQIAVENVHPLAIMTSYNINNGIPAADDTALCTSILRDEWGFDGLVMTDWGGGSSTPGISMHAGNDLIMPGKAPERIIRAVNSYDDKTGRQEQREGDPLHVSLGDVQKSVINILNIVIKTTQLS